MQRDFLVPEDAKRGVVFPEIPAVGFYRIRCQALLNSAKIEKLSDLVLQRPGAAQLGTSAL